MKYVPNINENDSYIMLGIIPNHDSASFGVKNK